MVLNRGSTVAITNGQGTVTDTFTYGPYGEQCGRTGKTRTPFLYNGRYGVETDNNGLYYMRARYYNPDIKRFINQDVVQGGLEDARSLNRFAYTNGNPANGIDPFGTGVIWITSDSTRIGHTSLLVQNDKGRWYYFFYGVNDVSLRMVSDLDMVSLEEFNCWTSEPKKNYYTSSTYIPCDSKEIYNECIKLVDNYDNRGNEGNWFYKLIAGNDCNPDYDAVTNNCSTVCWNVVMKGKLSDGRTIRKYMDDEFITMRTTDSPDLSCAKVSSGKPYVTQSYIEMMFENKAFTLKTYKKQINDKLKNAQKKGYTITYNGKIGIDMKKLGKIDKLKFLAGLISDSENKARITD